MIRTKTEIVYENIHKFFKYRGYTAVDFIPVESFKKQINLNGHYIQMADKCAVIITAEKSDSETKSDMVRKLIHGVKGGLDVILFVTSVLANSNVRKVIQAINAEGKTPVENYQYSMFLSEKPRHINMPLHEIATPAEVAEFEKINNMDARTFPRVFNTDPGVVWLGAKLGDVVKVTSPSDTAGNSIVYLIVVPETTIAQDVEEENE